MNSLSSELPFWHFDDHLLVFRDGSLGSGFLLTGKDISCATESNVNSFTKSLENILLSSSDEMKFQVYYEVDHDVSEVIEKHKNQISEGDGNLSKLAKARVDFLTSNAEERHYYKPRIYFFVRSKPFSYPKLSLFKAKGNDFGLTSRTAYSEHKTKFLRSLSQVRSALEASGFLPEHLEKNRVFSVLARKLNPNRSRTVGLQKLKDDSAIHPESLNSQLCLEDMSVGRNSLRFGKQQIRVVTLKTLPEGSTYASMIEGLLKLPFHFDIAQNIVVLDQKKERNKLELKRRIAHSMALGSDNVSDLESESKLTEIEDLLRDIVGGSEKLISTDLNVIVAGESESELDEKTDEILRAFKNLNQAEGVVETLPAKEAFLKSLPSTCEGLRQKIMKSSNVSHLMPVFAPREGNEIPVCLISTRESTLFSWDIFDKHLMNFNGLTFGSSGSGKSFTLCQLMIMFASSNRKPRIVWLDNGATSKRLVTTMGGQFIDLTLDSGISINMFDLPEGEIKPSSEKIKLILAVLEIMLKDDDQVGLPKRHKALLEAAIVETYASTNVTPTLNDLKKILGKHEDNEIAKYADTLFSWTGDTAFGRLVDRQSNVNIDASLTSFELESLNRQGELKNVMMLLLTSFIDQKAKQDSAEEYLLIIDEAERLLSGHNGKLAQDFVIGCYRTWRKFRSSIFCLSQNYKDFMTDESLRDALLINTNNLIILKQRKIDWEHFAESFGFNHAQVAAIKSLQSEKGVRSEIFLLQGDKEIILNLVPEPLSYWVCTSDGLDKAKIAEEMKNHPELDEFQVLERLAFPPNETVVSESLPA